MKKPISKAQIRKEIEQQTSKFLGQGGAVEEVQRGLSGRDERLGAIKPQHIPQDGQRTERTYVPEVIAALDARRNNKVEKPKPSKRRPRKKIIYDDFGEPLRWEWEE